MQLDENYLVEMSISCVGLSHEILFVMELLVWKLPKTKKLISYMFGKQYIVKHSNSISNDTGRQLVS